jgi:hypothetical protein
MFPPLDRDKTSHNNPAQIIFCRQLPETKPPALSRPTLPSRPPAADATFKPAYGDCVIPASSALPADRAPFAGPNQTLGYDP